MDEPLSSAGPTRATTTALCCDSVRCEARLQPRLKPTRCVPQGAKERALPLVLSMERPLGWVPGLCIIMTGGVPGLQSGAPLLGSGCRAQACPMCRPTSGRAVLKPLVPWQSTTAQKTRVEELILAVNGLL
jgi:hypothetical protein